MSRDRGQLLLIAAILVALVVIGSVVLLNGISFTENTGSEKTIRGAEQASLTKSEVRDDARQLFTELATNGVPFASASNYETALTRYNRTYANVSVVGSTGFTYLGLDSTASISGELVQQSTVEDYDDHDGGPLVTDIGTGSDAVVPFVRVSTTQRPGSSFTLRVTGGSGDEYEIVFEQNQLSVVPPGGSPTGLCDVSSSTISSSDDLTVTVAHGTGTVTTSADGVECSGFTLPEFTDPASVELVNGGDAEGTLSMTVGSGATITGTAPSTTGTTKLIDPAVDITYRSPVVQYSGTVTLMGGNIVR